MIEYLWIDDPSSIRNFLIKRVDGVILDTMYNLSSLSQPITKERTTEISRILLGGNAYQNIYQSNISGISWIKDWQSDIKNLIPATKMIELLTDFDQFIKEHNVYSTRIDTVKLGETTVIRTQQVTSSEVTIDLS
jgi:hypothetical protein